MQKWTVFLFGRLLNLNSMCSCNKTFKPKKLYYQEYYDYTLWPFSFDGMAQTLVHSWMIRWQWFIALAVSNLKSPSMSTNTSWLSNDHKRKKNAKNWLATFNELVSWKDHSYFNPFIYTTCIHMLWVPSFNVNNTQAQKCAASMWTLMKIYSVAMQKSKWQKI